MRVSVLNVEFDNVTLAEAVTRGTELLEAGGTHYVVTPNPEIVEACRGNEETLAAVNGADLVLPDGIGVIYGAKILHTPLKERVPGIEFAAGMLEVCARCGYPVFLLGAKPGVAEQAAQNLQERYPGLCIVGTHDGYFQEDAPVVEQIRGSGAKLVFVCLGAPKQELWMRRNGKETGAALLLGLGGSLDVFAGVVRRAPKFFCEHNLEWFYRLVTNPSRIGRMMKLPLFLLHVWEVRGK